MGTGNSILLAGDVGATKTTLALFELGSAFNIAAPVNQQSYSNAQFDDFDTLVAGYLLQAKVRPTVACLGVAGPVLAGVVHMTNLAWTITADHLRQRHGLQRVILINDLVATALGALHLPACDLHVLNRGIEADGAVKAMLAPGTGLGEAFLVPVDGRYLPCPSEGGHASFAPRTKEQIDLLRFLTSQNQHVAVEQVCSGLAIPDLFAFAARQYPAPEWLLTELADAVEKTPPIVRAALAAIQGGAPCEPAVRALSLFTEILADEAANLVLKTLALGGLYLGGGLAPRLLPFLSAGRFMPFFARGSYQAMLAQVPVHIVLNPQAALTGAAVHGCTQFSRP